MVNTVRFATRPTSQGDCQCLWQEPAIVGVAAEHSFLAHPVEYIQNALEDATQHQPVYSVPGTFPTSHKDAHQDLFSQAAPSQDLAPAFRSNFTTNTAVNSIPKNLDVHRPRKSADESNKKWKSNNKKLLVDRDIPDLLVRRVKKNIRKSSEHKLRELVSYKAELLNNMRTLVPIYTASTLEKEPKTRTRSEFGQTWLCHSCLTQLKTYLYYTPVTRSQYLYEHSVPAYLALLDDALAAVNANTEMENITHHELSSILHAELSVVEWRLSLKLARFHRRTDYLGVFPMEVGDYADLEIKRSLNQPEDGIFTITWKRIKHFGSV